MQGSSITRRRVDEVPVEKLLCFDGYAEEEGGAFGAGYGALHCLAVLEILGIDLGPGGLRA